ncbi:Hypothetical protein POVR2_LOCUS48 [uncultured virus]|nr:Hypothetical protein POVR2_LOCUS48 [uncultured virus]
MVDSATLTTLAASLDWLALLKLSRDTKSKSLARLAKHVKVFEEAILHDDPVSLEAIVARRPELAKRINHDLLIREIGYLGRSKIIYTLLKYTDPSSNNNEALMLAIRSRNATAIDALLLDKRVTSLLSTDDLNLMISNSRIRPDRLQIGDTGVVAYRSSYSLLLTVILVSTVPILDWMIVQRHRDFQLAAKNVLEGKQAGNAIEALLLAMLYPKMRVSKILRELDIGEALKAHRLIGAYLGLTELKKRM